MIELTDRIKRAERYAELCSAPKAATLARMIVGHWRDGTVPNMPDWTAEGEYPQIAADLWMLLRGDDPPLAGVQELMGQIKRRLRADGIDPESMTEEEVWNAYGPEWPGHEREEARDGS